MDNHHHREESARTDLSCQLFGFFCNGKLTSTVRVRTTLALLRGLTMKPAVPLTVEQRVETGELHGRLE
jgi:hypothetical protein